MHTQHTTPGRRRIAGLVAATLATAATVVLATPPALGTSAPASATTADATRTVKGTLADGAPYVIKVPADWNGTLALYSHGLIFPGDPDVPRPAVDGAVGEYLLDHGVALAGSAFGTGWAVEEAIHDQRATVREVAQQFGRPKRVIAYGDSLGGMISTALVERFPKKFDGALAMCGAQAGGVGGWNHFLDSAFVFTTLLEQADGVRLTHIEDPVGNMTAAAQALETAAATPAGRARLALVAAVAQIPGAIDPSGPVSAPTVAERFQARLEWMRAPYLPLVFAERGELEARAGGNPSSNAGVDYGRLLRLSGQAADVQALYAEAGIDLAGDLDQLAGADRVHADPDAATYLKRNVTLTGKLRRPVLTFRNVADGALPSSHDRAYAEAVARAGRRTMLRQAFAGRPGHCTFTPAETVTALRTLNRRIGTGAWGRTTPAVMNRRALALGAELNQGGGFPVPPAFVHHEPRPFPSLD